MEHIEDVLGSGASWAAEDDKYQTSIISPVWDAFRHRKPYLWVCSFEFGFDGAKTAYFNRPSRAKPAQSSNHFEDNGEGCLSYLCKCLCWCNWHSIEISPLKKWSLVCAVRSAVMSRMNSTTLPVNRWLHVEEVMEMCIPVALKMEAGSHSNALEC